MNRFAFMLAAGLLLAVALGAAGCDAGGQPEESDYEAISGKIIFSVLEDHRYHLVVLDGARVTGLLRSAGDMLHPAWSPDGSRIAYVARHDAGARYSDLVLMNADGTERKAVLSLGAYEDPDWAPEGDRISYVYDAGLYILPLSGRPQQVEGTPDQVRHPAWSPRGDRIAFSSRGDIYVINVDGRELKRLTDDPETEEHPAWSPDGEQIVFSRKPSPFPDLYVMQADGTNKILLVEDGRWPTWSSHSDEIAFDRFGSGLHTIRSDGTQLRPVSRPRSDLHTVFYPDWH